MVDYEKKFYEAMMHLDVAAKRNPDPDVKGIVEAGKIFITLYMNYVYDNKNKDPYAYVRGIHDLEKATEDISKCLEEGKK